MSKLLLESLVPKDKPTVMQLVKTAGIDVSDWQKYKGGKKRAASNPKYCYDWSFIDDKGTIVLNLWYQNLTIRNGDIVAELNYRRKFTTSSSIANGVMNARSEKFDGALRKAYEQSLPIRVIINDGVRRNRNVPDAKASSVKKRMLDTIPWFVRSYEFTTGDCIVNRGIISKSSTQYTTSDRSNAEDAVEQE